MVIEGGPEHVETWDALDRLLTRTWPHAGAAALRLAKLAIDSGFDALAVYAWARRAGVAQLAPVKGVEGFNRSSPVSGPTFVDATDGGKRLRRGARLWTVAVSTFKAETYRFLRLDRPTDEGETEPSRQWRGVSPSNAEGARFPAGTVHLPHWVETEWLKQLTAEQLVTVRTKRDFARLEWQKLRERNEALDCRVYARAAAWIAGADRWSDAKWQDLEEQLGVPSEDEATAGVVNRVSLARIFHEADGAFGLRGVGAWLRRLVLAVLRWGEVDGVVCGVGGLDGAQHRDCRRTSSRPRPAATVGAAVATAGYPGFSRYATRMNNARAGTGAGEVEAPASAVADDDGTGLQQLERDGGDLGACQLAALQAQAADCRHQHIGEAGQQQAELVRPPAVAGGAVGEEAVRIAV